MRCSLTPCPATMIHFLILCLRIFPTLSSPARQKDLEFFVKEEVRKGTVIASGGDLGDLHLVEASSAPDRVPKILNHKDKGVGSFALQFLSTTLQLVVTDRIDREAICPPGVADSNGDSHPLDFFIDDTKGTSRLQRNALLPGLNSVQPGNRDCAIGLRVAASFQGEQNLYDITIYVQDINDNPPKWPQSSLVVTFRDGDPTGTRQTLLLAIDTDSGGNALITYRLEAVSPSPGHISFYPQQPSSSSAVQVSALDMFELVKDTPAAGDMARNRLLLVSKSNIDREAQPQGWDLVLTAVNSESSEQLTARLPIHVNITDINDNTPQFSQSIYQPQLDNQHIGVVPENIPVGSRLLQLTATDNDAGPNAELTYSFVPGSNTRLMQHFFSIDPKSGELRTVRRLEVDRKADTGTLYLPSGAPISFEVQVVDGADAAYARTGFATVRMKVEDVDDEAPEIRVHAVTAWRGDGSAGVGGLNPPVDAELSVTENKPAGQLIGLMKVSDPDHNGNEMIRCSLVGQNTEKFRLTQDDVNANEYRIYSANSLDRETTSRLVVGLECRDFTDHATQIRLGVNVIDTNDNAPVFTEKIYNLSVFEDDGELQPTARYSSSFNRSWLTSDGTAFVLAHDLDTGENQRIAYHLATTAGDEKNSVSLISIDPKTGQLFAHGPFDREQEALHTFTVYAVDNGTSALTGSCLLHVKVADVNDNLPVFVHTSELPESVGVGSYNFAVGENQFPGTKVGQVQAYDADESSDAEFGQANGDGQFNSHLTEMLNARKTRKPVVTSGLVYSLSPGKNSQAFWIDPKTGVITTRSVLDRETQATYTFQVNVRDGPLPREEHKGRSNHQLKGGGALTRSHLVSTTVVVTVQDENDNDPVFVQPNATNHMILLDPAAIPGRLLFTLLAADPDEGLNGEVVYSIRGGNTGSLFSIDPRSGLLYLQNPIPHRTIVDATTAAASGAAALSAPSDASVLMATGDAGDRGHQTGVTSAPAIANRQHRPIHPTYLLALEACDQGQPPRCTHFPNLQIQVRPHETSLGNLLLQNENQAYLTQSPAYGHLSETGASGVSRGLWNQTVIEVVTICLSILFSLLLIIIMMAACFLRRRAQPRSGQSAERKANGNTGWSSTPKRATMEILNQSAGLINCNKELSMASSIPATLHTVLPNKITTYGNYQGEAIALANGNSMLRTVYASNMIHPSSLANNSMKDRFTPHDTSTMQNMTASYDSEAYQVMDSWSGMDPQNVVLTGYPSRQVATEQLRFPEQHQPLLTRQAGGRTGMSSGPPDDCDDPPKQEGNCESSTFVRTSGAVEGGTPNTWTETSASQSVQRNSKAALRAYAGFPKASFV